MKFFLVGTTYQYYFCTFFDLKFGSLYIGDVDHFHVNGGQLGSEKRNGRRADLDVERKGTIRQVNKFQCPLDGPGSHMMMKNVFGDSTPKCQKEKLEVVLPILVCFVPLVIDHNPGYKS